MLLYYVDSKSCLPQSCPQTSFAPVSIRVGIVLLPCVLRAFHSAIATKRAVPQYLSCTICVQKCNEYLVSIIIFECSLYSRTWVCNRMIRRTIHIPGTYHTTAAAVPVPVIILQSVTASLRLLAAVVRLHRTGTRACSRCVVVFFSFCSVFFFSISSRINPRIL